MSRRSDDKEPKTLARSLDLDNSVPMETQQKAQAAIRQCIQLRRAIRKFCWTIPDAFDEAGEIARAAHLIKGRDDLMKIMQSYEHLPKHVARVNSCRRLRVPMQMRATPG